MIYAKLSYTNTGSKKLPHTNKTDYNCKLLHLQNNGLMAIDVDQPNVERNDVIKAVKDEGYEKFILRKTGKGWHIILKCNDKTQQTAVKQNWGGFYPVDFLHNHHIIYKTYPKLESNFEMPTYKDDKEYKYEFDELDEYNPTSKDDDTESTDVFDSIDDNDDEETEEAEDEDDRIVETQDDDLEKLFDDSKYDFSNHNNWVKLGTWIKFFYNKDKEGLELWKTYCMRTLKNKQDITEYQRCWKSFKKEKMNFFWIYKHILQDIKNENIQVLEYKINEYTAFVRNKDFTYNLHGLLRYIKKTFCVILDDKDVAKYINVKNELSNYNYKKKNNDFHIWAKFRMNGKLMGIYDIFKNPMYQDYINSKYNCEFWIGDNQNYYHSLNSFRGFEATISNTSEGTEFLFQHIEKVLCGGNKEFYNYYLEWLYQILFNQVQTGICILFQDSFTGCGKGRWNSFLIGKVIGEYVSLRTDINSFGGSFNSNVFDKVYICFDEVPSKNKSHTKATWESIKSFITDQAQVKKEKFCNDSKVEFFGNFTWNLQHITDAFLDEQDRRVASISTKPRPFKDAKEKAEFWEPKTGFWDRSIAKYKDIGGRFLKGLEERRPKDVNLCRIPDTEARRALIASSCSSANLFLKQIEEWYKEDRPKGKDFIVDLNDPNRDGRIIYHDDEKISLNDLYKDYKSLMLLESNKPVIMRNFIKDISRYAKVSRSNKNYNNEQILHLSTINTSVPRSN